MPRAPAANDDDDRPPAAGPPGDPCCPHYHAAVELIGRRWNGAIVDVLLRAPQPLRFTDLSAGVPDISDRLLAQRLKQLAHDGILQRSGDASQPRYALTPKGRELQPAIDALTAWGRRWLDTSASSFRQA
jgi:DNA-binding HxlR family transcriptional regulator